MASPCKLVLEYIPRIGRFTTLLTHIVCDIVFFIKPYERVAPLDAVLCDELERLRICRQANVVKEDWCVFGSSHPLSVGLFDGGILGWVLGLGVG